MKYLFQFLRILLFCLLGEVAHYILPLPIPSSVYGLIFLLIALNVGVVQLFQVKQTSSFLISIFPMLFVPGTVGVMELWNILKEFWLPILTALIPITILVFVVSGRVTQAIVGRKEYE